MEVEKSGGVVPPLFETKAMKGRAVYKLFAFTVFIGICLIWVYRITHLPSEEQGGRWAWLGMLMAELWFGFYWVITQSVRWNVTYKYPFKDRLSSRYEEKLPGVDIFVCTADPKIEPPTMVINTVLSTMSYNYPTDKLSIYLSDDGGSELTFYALLEASEFSKKWIPFCKKFKVEPRSPSSYFLQNPNPENTKFSKELLAIKKLYEDMIIRIETAMEKGSVSEDIKCIHKGFSEWNSEVKKNDHQSIVQILIDGRNPDNMDDDGHGLPTLVYLAREKRPNWPHNFKAGAMNALLRVSSVISNGPIILNLDCDMYANDSDAVREALCFFMDECGGSDVSFVQYPQCYDNIKKNDTYANVRNVLCKLGLSGMDGYGAAIYCGTGCFHRRDSLSGKYSKDCKIEWGNATGNTEGRTVDELEEASKALANCSFEKNTQWGKEMGLIYGCPVEDVITGLAMLCRGWKSVFYNPDRTGFLGVSPITLDQSLVQFKRWSEGMFQIFFSKYCPFTYGFEAAMTIADSNGAPTRLEGKYIAMVVCWVLGLGSLVSWNSMLTIGDYYYAIFEHYHPSRVLTLVYQPFALGTIATLAYNESKIDTRRRNIFGYTLFFLSTLALLIVDLATSGHGGVRNFVGICVIVGAFGVADAHVQGGMVGDLSFMCPEFIQSFLAGLAASGALTSGLRLMTKAAFEKAHNGLRKGTMLFLAISTFLEFLCIFLYAFIFPKLPIVKHYRAKAASEGSKTVSADLAAAGIQTPENQQAADGAKEQDRLSNKQLFFENIDYVLDLFLIYVLTLSIFPGFVYENTGSHGLGSWYVLVLIAMYNVWDLISRYIPLIKCLKLESRKGLMLATLSRLLLVPAFYFTAKYGDQGWMIMLTSFLGLTNGYLTVCVLTAAPKGYKGPEQNALGNLLVMCLLGGIFAGVALDWLWLIGSSEKF